MSVTIQRDLWMMKSPQHWPHPVLPMKRGDHLATTELALWDGQALHIGADLYGLHRAHCVLRMTPEQIVALGWEID